MAAVVVRKIMKFEVVSQTKILSSTGQSFRGMFIFLMVLTIEAGIYDIIVSF
jgi:hypothetical protein